MTSGAIAVAGLGDRVRAHYTTRHGAGSSVAPYASFNLGDRVGDDATIVQANRAQLQACLALESPPRWLHQVHGTRCVINDDAVPTVASEADASLTRTPGVACAVLTADCLPILMAAADGSEVAAVHAGWRGLAAGVIESALAQFRSPPGGVRAWLGPAIGARAYEVGDEVRRAFVAAHGRDAAGFSPSINGRWHCDLFVLARLRLQRYGVSAVIGGGRCTYSEPDSFYSYRRDGITGRQAAVIWIEPRFSW